MLDPNPYLSPESKNDASPPSTSQRSDLRAVRFIFYLHLAAVLLCTFFTLVDTRLLRIPEPPFLLQRVMGVLALIAVCGIWIFPFAIMFAASNLKTRPVPFRIAIVAADLALSIFQMWVVMPLVQ